jgi:hypothetical protein
MDFLKFHPGLPCLILLHPAGIPTLKRPYSRFRGGPPAGQVACSRLLPLWTPLAVRLYICSHRKSRFVFECIEDEVHDQGDNVKKEYS